MYKNFLANWSCMIRRYHIRRNSIWRILTTPVTLQSWSLNSRCCFFTLARWNFQRLRDCCLIMLHHIKPRFRHCAIRSHVSELTNRNFKQINFFFSLAFALTGNFVLNSGWLTVVFKYIKVLIIWLYEFRYSSYLAYLVKLSDSTIQFWILRSLFA